MIFFFLFFFFLISVTLSTYSESLNEQHGACDAFAETTKAPTEVRDTDDVSSSEDSTDIDGSSLISYTGDDEYTYLLSLAHNMTNSTFEELLTQAGELYMYCISCLDYLFLLSVLFLVFIFT